MLNNIILQGQSKFYARFIQDEVHPDRCSTGISENIVFKAAFVVAFLFSGALNSCRSTAVLTFPLSPQVGGCQDCFYFALIKILQLKGGAVMSPPWKARAFDTEEAAKLSGIKPAQFHLIVHRNRDLAILFATKIKGRYRLSLRDICTLRIAMELERGGRVWVTALAQAWQHCASLPSPDSVLIVPANSVSASSGWTISDSDVSKLQIDETLLAIPIGKICAEITERAESL